MTNKGFATKTSSSPSHYRCHNKRLCLLDLLICYQRANCQCRYGYIESMNTDHNFTFVGKWKYNKYTLHNLINYSVSTESAIQ